ncbi:efflux RND transporter periplasmic adaptor subunit [bacterium]|nr:efflux RND transporter periplasmic adaptor subunit [bacterium]
MKKVFTKKNIIIAVILVIVLTVIIFSIISNANKPKYKTVEVEKRTIVQTVDASGTINPVKTVSIGTQVSGIISAIYVDFNSKVKKGQLLAQIDPALFQAQVNKSAGDLAAARANYQKTISVLNYDRKVYNRYNRLYKKDYVARNDVDEKEANYYSDRADLNNKSGIIQQARATLQSNLTNLKYTKIISPVDGVVVSRAVDVGQTVAASFQTPTLFSVAQDLTKMQIEVSVSEADIGKVQVGQDVDYTLDGYPDEVFHGRVYQVRLSPTTVSNVVTYTVIVRVDNKDGKLKPGMSADVSIIVSKKENVLSVDNSAFRFTPKDVTGGKKYEHQGIWVLRKNRPVRISLKTGVTDSDYTEIITDEIFAGDKIIVGKLGDKRNSDSMGKPPGMF